MYPMWTMGVGGVVGKPRFLSWVFWCFCVTVSIHIKEPQTLLVCHYEPEPSTGVLLSLASLIFVPRDSSANRALKPPSYFC